MPSTTHSNDRFLRRALQANAAFSTISGLTFIAAARPIAEFIGISPPLILMFVGASLLPFAAGLLASSLRPVPNILEARIAIALDAAWVLGSFILITAGLFTTGGNWAVAAVADIVLIFALAQYLGLRKLTKRPLQHQGTT